MTIIKYDFEPSPGPQTEAFQYAPDELFYGGAAGGGKSRMARAAAVILCATVPGVRVVLFRNSFPELRDAVEAPMLAETPEGLARYNQSAHEFRFLNGSVLALKHLNSNKDLTKYQGAEYQLVIFEEVTHFTERQYLYLKSRLRVAGRVKDRMQSLGLRPRMIATGNPGGIGHHWVKARFVDPVPAGTPFRLEPTEDEPNPGVRLYIHAKATDNPHVDSGYIDMLNALPEGEKQALRDGDWNVLDGVRFPGFKSNVHVIDPEDFPIPEFGAHRALGVDWGTAAPFAGVWVAKVGNIFIAYREVYQKNLGPAEQAAMLASVENSHERGPGRINTPVVLDPAMYAKAAHNPLSAINTDTPPPGSMAWYYYKQFGSSIKRANNDRLGGASTVDQLLAPVDMGGEMMPRLYIYSTCRNLIRTLPALPRDEKNPEDVDTHAEDHGYDALRYALMELVGKPLYRPSAAAHPVKRKPITAGIRSKTL